MFLDDTACNLASLNLMYLRERTKARATSTSEGSSHAVPAVDRDARDLGPHGAVPVAGDRPAAPTTTARWASATPTRRAPDGARHPLRQRSRAAPCCGAITALMTGVAYRTSAEMAGELGPFPAYKDNREAMLRVIRNHRRAAYGEPGGDYEDLAITRRCRIDARRKTARTPSSSTAPRRRGTRRSSSATIHGYRNAQVTRDRADRHDRPGHGLRHHGHRAGLRPGQVQEAGRRRLLQDHQPGGARGPARARLQRAPDRRHRPLCGRARHARRAAHQLRRQLLPPRASPNERHGALEAQLAVKARSTSASRSTLDARRDVLPQRARLPEDVSSTTPASTCCAHLGFHGEDQIEERQLHAAGR